MKISEEKSLLQRYYKDDRRKDDELNSARCRSRGSYTPHSDGRIDVMLGHPSGPFAAEISLTLKEVTTMYHTMMAAELMKGKK